MTHAYPTDEEIARQAAEQICDKMDGFSLYCSGVEKIENGLTAIILTAARRIAAGMVRETGWEALEAITTDQGRLCEAVHHGKGDYHTGLAPCPVCQRIESALAKLRAITGEGENK